MADADSPPERAGSAARGDEVPETLMNAIIDDAMARSNAGRTEMVVRRAAAVTWGDPSLGCPEPGMAYPQVVVGGFWVELEHAGRIYDYRATTRGDFKLCEQPTRTPGQPGNPDL